MRVETVDDRSSFDEFVALPGQLHPRTLSVPLLESTMRSWWRGTGPHPAKVELLLVRDDAGRVRGRSTVHHEPRLDARLGKRSLLFGATEFDSRESLAALLAAVEERAAGHEQLVGPVALLPNQTGGVITSGFRDRGFVDSAWNPPSYPAAYEALGFERLWESDTWLVETRDRPAGHPLGPVSAPEWAAAGVRPERVRRSQIEALRPQLLAVLNRAFEKLPYYTEITPSEFDAATAGLSVLIDPRLLLLARDAVTDEIASFALVVPDYTRFLQSTGGRPGALDQLRLLATRSQYRREAVLVIQGTEPRHQGRGILALLSRQLQANLAQAGYRRLRSTYVGRDNPRSGRQFERFGGRPLHGYTFYRRPIGERMHP